jgi:hypothetical protein
MDECPICHKPMLVAPGVTNVHHFYHPRKLFQVKKFRQYLAPVYQMDVHIFCHKQYTHHFINYCWNDHNRTPERCGDCRYTAVCCYDES